MLGLLIVPALLVTGSLLVWELGVKPRDKQRFRDGWTDKRIESPTKTCKEGRKKKKSQQKN